MTPIKSAQQKAYFKQAVKKRKRPVREITPEQRARMVEGLRKYHEKRKALHTIVEIRTNNVPALVEVLASALKVQGIESVQIKKK